MLAKRAQLILLSGAILLAAPLFFILSGRWQGGRQLFKQIGGQAEDQPHHQEEHVLDGQVDNGTAHTTLATHATSTSSETFTSVATSTSLASLASPKATYSAEQLDKAAKENMAVVHLNLTSNFTSDGNYFPLQFGRVGSEDVAGFNPSIIVHPDRDTYLMIAQRKGSVIPDAPLISVEVSCEAKFRGNELHCVTEPRNLPVPATVSVLCSKERLENYQLGARDARAFWGPTAPYLMYNSQTTYNCAGMWLQDLRRLVDWGGLALESTKDPFTYPTMLQRPEPVGRVEKNWFAFWDLDDNMYLHYDIKPSRRAFARLNSPWNGTVGPDLAPLAAKTDSQCLAKFVPKVKTDHEHVHQATNSLRVTMCSRSDEKCTKGAGKTFNFAIFHFKAFYSHDEYQPYVMVFSALPPFEIYGISSKPLWFSGRGEPGGAWLQAPGREHVSKDQREMVFTTSLSWTGRGQKYDGFLDDDIFVNFGIEDGESGSIAVKAKDLLAELNMC